MASRWIKWKLSLLVVLVWLWLTAPPKNVLKVLHLNSPATLFQIVFMFLWPSVGFFYSFILLQWCRVVLRGVGSTPWHQRWVWFKCSHEIPYFNLTDIMDAQHKTTKVALYVTVEHLWFLNRHLSKHNQATGVSLCQFLFKLNFLLHDEPFIALVISELS